MQTGVSLVKREKKKMNRIVVNTTDLHHSENNLFALIGANRLFYFITSCNQEVLVQYSQPLDKEALVSVFEKDSYLNRAFKSVNIGILSPYSTLVPNLIYKEEAATSYLENSFRLPHQHYLLIDNLPSLQCQNVFLASIPIYNFFQKKFENGVFFHAATPLLIAWQEQAVQHQKPTVFINVIGDEFQIAAYNRDKLLLFNTFQYKSAKDFMYYALLVFDQLNLEVEQTMLLLSGEIMQHSEIYKLLYRYIREIRFLSRTTSYQFDKQFEQQPEHFNFGLYSFYTVSR